MLKKILFIILLIVFIGFLYLLNTDSRTVLLKKDTNKITSVPTLDIPQQSVDFMIIKKEGMFTFIGNFSEEKTAQKLLRILPKGKTEHNITINSALSPDMDVALLTTKLLEIFTEHYSEGKIEVKDRKLLISGKVIDPGIKEKINALLTYSTVNSFDNTELHSETLVITSELNVLLQEDRTSQLLSVDDLNATLSKLQAVAESHPLKAMPVIQKKEMHKEVKTSLSQSSKEIRQVKLPVIQNTPPLPKIVKKEKRLETMNKFTNQPQKSVIEKPVEISPKVKAVAQKVSLKEEKTIEERKVMSEVPLPGLSEAEAYQRKLREQIPENDIMSLPSVEIVDINIETKIKKGEVAALTTKKPMVEKATILVPSNEGKVTQDIPFAKLYGAQEQLNGIVQEEVIASPIQSKAD